MVSPSMVSNRDDFEHWLISMDEFLEEFLTEFSKEEQNRLNYTLESLDIVEARILELYPNMKAMLVPSESQRVNLIACYVGETIRKNLGGKWDIRLKDPKFAFHGMPILIGPYDPECPLSLATASADRRTGIYLRTVLANL